MSYARSRSNSCSRASYSRSRSSRSTSMASSRRSARTNYALIANEIINGAPLDTVLKRDLKHVLIQLSILRNEATALKDYVKIDYIGDIIKELNKRVTPPPMKRYRSGKNSPNKLSKVGTIAEFLDLDVDDGAQNLCPAIIKELPDDEYRKISEEIDQMIETDTILDTIDIRELPKYYFVINQKKEQHLDSYNYDEVKKLDDLYDKLRYPVHDFKPRNEIKIEELEDRIEKCNVEIDNLCEQRADVLMNIEQRKELELQKLKEKHQQELDDFLKNMPSPDDPSQNRPSKKLMEMRHSERRHAMTRDYEGAKELHKVANDLAAEERAKNKIKYQERLEKLTENLRMKQKAEESCLIQKWDRVATKDINNIDKMISTNKSLILSAQKELEATTKKDSFNLSPRKLML
ncbi:hypothetical protein TRFO_23067 [Tritrichomonas foetus]|uniref:Uncharacterized protein n=1 Tax=Tritrichomonas foetus TaxID=1144522 RepID=A0A1J4KFB6_9EUKA|nr:hypothetical protein TRFO_23067 [Tritrichomonas foetus]|eukprot:OHT08460.1 hypothetical protein TRFO_23067 [Tritrichomonas foetus]